MNVRQINVLFRVFHVISKFFVISGHIPSDINDQIGEINLWRDWDFSLSSLKQFLDWMYETSCNWIPVN